jgi:hypothetical protein
MIELTITLVSAVLCLILFLVFRLKREAPPHDFDRTTEHQIAGVTAVYVEHLETLFGREDYKRLGATPKLRPVRAQFRRERRWLVLMWLDELRRDIRMLRKFRRFLVAKELRASLGEELRALLAAVYALASVALVRLMVSAFGPFAVRGVLRKVQAPVARLAGDALHLLERVPSEMRPEIERTWARVVVASEAG